MHDEMIQVGGILRAAREAKGMTQAALAKATDKAERTIMDLENDKRHPSLEVLYKIINALDFSADHIFRPKKVPCTLEQERLLREIQSCNERDQAVVIETACACVRALQREMGAKKQTVIKPSVFAVLLLLDKMSRGQSIGIKNDPLPHGFFKPLYGG